MHSCRPPAAFCSWRRGSAGELLARGGEESEPFCSGRLGARASLWLGEPGASAGEALAWGGEAFAEGGEGARAAFLLGEPRSGGEAFAEEPGESAGAFLLGEPGAGEAFFCCEAGLSKVLRLERRGEGRGGQNVAP